MLEGAVGGRTGDERGVVRDEEGDELGDVFWLAITSENAQAVELHPFLSDGSKTPWTSSQLTDCVHEPLGWPVLEVWYSSKYPTVKRRYP